MLHDGIYHFKLSKTIRVVPLVFMWAFTFSLILFLFTVSAFSVMSWFIVWVIIEGSLVVLLPLLIGATTYSNESGVKYFLVQSISGILFLFEWTSSILPNDHSFSTNLTAFSKITPSLLSYSETILTPRVNNSKATNNYSSFTRRDQGGVSLSGWFQESIY